MIELPFIVKGIETENTSFITHLCVYFVMRVGFPYCNDNEQDENKIYLLGNLDNKYYVLSLQDKSNLKYKYLR